MSTLPQTRGEFSREPSGRRGEGEGGLPSAPGASVRRLPEGLIDQIAAGEVVERPASVVKELVENALDAGAGRIRVEVREGGAALVAVTDDGAGMGPEDARLALERHATSKLGRLEDLEGIRSFGFRGEALPAIASVARVRLRTRARGAPEGCEILVEAGRRLEERAAGGPEGTRVEVAELFAGVPARRKFLKSPATEWGHVADWLARAALARPDVHFDVAREGRRALAWPAVQDPVERVAAVLSERDAAALVRAERAHPGLAVRVLASRPDVHRSSGSGIHLFVNGRPVRDRLLRHAVLQVYRDLLPRGRFPIALVFLDVEPRAVDVNVHPAKWEVRFGEPRAVHHLVGAALREALGERAWMGAPPQAPARAGGAEEGAVRGTPGRVGEPAPAEAGWLFAGRAGPAASAAESDAGTPSPEAPASGAAEARPVRFGDLRLAGQALATYLLVETGEGLLLVDQHAAHERVLYERLRAAWLSGGVERQPLLTPATAELEPAAVAALAAGADTVRALGFEVEPFGEATAAVRAVPALLAGRDPVALLAGLADELRSAGAADAPSEASARLLPAADRILATVACHSARRAGDALEPREARALLDALDTIPWAPCCPHGRPVAVPLSRSEIERRFGRG